MIFSVKVLSTLPSLKASRAPTPTSCTAPRPSFRKYTSAGRTSLPALSPPSSCTSILHAGRSLPASHLAHPKLSSFTLFCFSKSLEGLSARFSTFLESCLVS